MSNSEKIKCEECGEEVFSIKYHLSKNPETHNNMTIEEYMEKYPGAPILSDVAKKYVEEKIDSRKKEISKKKEIENKYFGTEDFSKIFGFSPSSYTKNKRGEEIKTLVQNHYDNAEDIKYVPEEDQNYVYPIELLKTVLIAFQANMPLYLWGYHGTGKTTLIEQSCSKTKRPFLRVQHTINTEESHILGQYVVRDGATIFQPGPLLDAMRHGYVYCADEYDFALPSVLSVYQPVLEGKPLVIKDAPSEYRITKAHPNFRFVGTGNTNGGGDETGLYQGTQMQNAANYSRFALTEEVKYMEPDIEAAVVASQARIEKADAENLVKFAGKIRDSFMAGTLTTTVSSRELINAARNAKIRGEDWKKGIEQAFINRLNRIDQEAAREVAQRIWG